MTYTSTTKYLDANTGEQIRWPNKNYIKIKTKKHVNTNWAQGICTIEYTVICDKQRQKRLFD